MQLYYQDPKDPADKTVIGFDYSDFLGGDTIGGSSWAVVPEGELVITDAASTPSATVITVAEGDAGTTYRLTNVITTADGLQESRTAILPVSGDVLTGAYLSVSEAAARLWGRWGIESDLTVGDLAIAGFEFDETMGPFIGSRLADDQNLRFPRSVNPDGTENTSEVVPEPVLDWVALRAHVLSSDEDPPVKSEGAGRVSVTYELPKVSQAEKRMLGLLSPYQRRMGCRL